MGKTLFSDGNPLQGILGTIVNAEFLNKIFNHRHDGLDQDGSAPSSYAVDQGAANAYVIALTPALTAHINGMPLQFMATNTNSGASTLTVNGLGAVSITLADGSALNHGNIRKNGIYTVAYTGTAYQLLNPSIRTGLMSKELYLPSGYLKRNGALISRTAYADLYSWASANGLIVSEASWSGNNWGLFGSGDGATTFRLPDFRGEFERGWDDGRGVDSGRTLGSAQTDAFKSHTHTVIATVTGAAHPASTGAYNCISASGQETYATGAVETRPRNIAMMAIIKY